MFWNSTNKHLNLYTHDNTHLRSMVDKTVLWAQKTGNIRSNEVHGEDEMRLILNETFLHKEVSQEETNREGSIEVEAWVRGIPKTEDSMQYNYNTSTPRIPGQDESGTLLDSDLPDFHGPAEALVGAGSKDNKPQTAPNSSSVMSFKLGSQDLSFQLQMMQMFFLNSTPIPHDTAFRF